METTAAIDSAPRAGRREWIGLAVLALPTLLLSVDLTVLFLALPRLSADLHPSSTEQLWIIDIYGFVLAGFLVTMGTLGDRIGRRKLLLIGATAFGVASLLAAYSTSAGMLIGARALMGIAGATLMPSSLALIGNMFKDDKQRGTAIAAWMSCFLGGIAAGPVIGGVLLQNFWWGSVFLLAVPIMAVLLIVAPLLLPEFRAPSSSRLDLLSVALFLAGILPIIYGLKELARAGWRPVPIAVFVVGVVFAVLFVQRQKRLADPLLDLRLFSRRSFSASLSLMLLVGVIQGGVLLLVNLYLQDVANLSPLDAGLCLVPTAFAMIASMMSAPALARRWSPPYVIAAGLAISAIGYVVLTQLPSSHGVTTLIIGQIFVMIGVGPMSALVPHMVLGSVPPEKAGSAASVMNTSSELGIAFGVAAIGSLGAVIYRSRLTGAIPATVPSGAVSTARQSINDAVTAGASLTGAARAELLDAARGAFTSSLNIVATVAVVLFIGFAVLAATALRNASPAPEASEPAPADKAAAQPSEPDAEARQVK